MTALTWQSAPPAKDGLYFYRPIGGTRAVAQIRNGMIEFPVVGNASVAISLQLFNGVQWAGPIEEPGEGEG